MTSKYILTGPPGSGKSSIMLELEARGEYIIREVAEDVIRRHQAKGIERPWEMPDFQREILRLQVQREKKIPRDIKRAFIDRGIPDGLGYTEPGTEISREIHRQCREYAGVFFVESLGEVKQTKVRREDEIAAFETGERIREIYRAAGYYTPIICAGPVDIRTDRILQIIKNREKKEDYQSKKSGHPIEYNDLSDYGGLTGNA